MLIIKSIRSMCIIKKPQSELIKENFQVKQSYLKDKSTLPPFQYLDIDFVASHSSKTHHK